MNRRTAILGMLAGALVLGACDQSPTGHNGSARLTVLLTDAPIDYLQSAEVTISRVEILPMEGGPVVVSSSGGTWDMLQLQNGVTTQLGSVEIEPGTYRELRVVIEEAYLTLKDGYTFADGSTTQRLKVPSGSSSGVKVKLASTTGESGIEIRPGETVLVVDFDVSQNFVINGNPNTPAGIKGFVFKPVLRAVVRNVAGSIAGTLTAPQGVAVEGLQVRATRVGAPEDEVPATTLVAADGTWKIHFLRPGAYVVTVANPPTGQVSNSVEVTVGEAAHVTGVALTLAPPSS